MESRTRLIPATLWAMAHATEGTAKGERPPSWVSMPRTESPTDSPCWELSGPLSPKPAPSSIDNSGSSAHQQHLVDAMVQALLCPLQPSLTIEHVARIEEISGHAPGSCPLPSDPFRPSCIPEERTLGPRWTGFHCDWRQSARSAHSLKFVASQQSRAMHPRSWPPKKCWLDALPL